MAIWHCSGQREKGKRPREGLLNSTKITRFCVRRRPFSVFFWLGIEKTTMEAVFRSWGSKWLKVVLRVEEKQERNLIFAGLRYHISFGLSASKLLTAEKLIFFFFCLSRATPMVYGSSQARGCIGAAAVGLCYSHSNARAKPWPRPTPQVTATLGP